MGRLIGTTTTYSFLPNTPFTNSYSYDADSNRTGYTAPDGSTNTYSYDTLNRLTALANSWAGSFGFAYDSLSRLTQMTRPNGITTNYTYDSLSRLLSVLHQVFRARLGRVDTKSNGVPGARRTRARWGRCTIDGAVYALDAAGNRTAKTDDLAGVTSNYTYDQIYELTQVMQGATTTESYGYDPVGNRLSSLNLPSYTVNSSNELTGTSNASYTYDQEGNTTGKTDSTGTTNYTWDFENRLTSVTLSGTGGTVTFKYDPFGRRIQKAFTQNGTTTTTNYLYNGDNTVETTDQNGSITAKFAQGQGIDEPLAESTSGGTDYYEADGLGSVTSLTSATGSIAQTYTYDSFGNTTNSSGNIANPFRYTGRDFDSETGLFYYRARYYDPTTGHFLSEDPAGFYEGFNFYPYVENDPTDSTDPSGLAPKCQKCSVPQHPPSADIYQNIWQSQQNGFYWWYTTATPNHGPWDYKRLGGDHPEYDAFGNFNFGATGAAMGIPLNLLLRGAGAEKFRAFHHKGASDPYGNPLGRKPYGNQPEKQQQIINGYNFFKNCMPPNDGFGGGQGSESGSSFGGGGGGPF